MVGDVLGPDKRLEGALGLDERDVVDLRKIERAYVEIRGGARI